VTVACVLKSGGVFTPEWVYRLQTQCSRYLPAHNFVCLTDLELDCETIPLENDWPGFWSKLELWRPDILTGRNVFFDLDTLIVRDASCLFDYNGNLAGIDDFFHPSLTATGVLAWDGSTTRNIWAWIQNNPPPFEGRSDRYLDPLFSTADRLQVYYPGLIGSYKAHHLADGARGYSVVCFHGKPRLSDLPPNNWARQHWEAQDGIWQNARAA